MDDPEKCQKHATHHEPESWVPMKEPGFGELPVFHFLVSHEIPINKKDTIANNLNMSKTLIWG